MGRWRGNKREDRICKLCGEGIEDEKHFLRIFENLNEDEKSD